jgi:hypothetical protein
LNAVIGESAENAGNVVRRDQDQVMSVVEGTARNASPIRLSSTLSKENAGEPKCLPSPYKPNKFTLLLGRGAEAKNDQHLKGV